MPESSESQDVEIPCPYCSGSVHAYSMIVRSVTVAGFAAGSRAMTLTRLFTCPTSSKDFQASIRLVQREGEKLVAVDFAPRSTTHADEGR